MTISADIVTPVIDAAPGEAAVGKLRVRNGGSTPATFHVRTVGLDSVSVVGGQHGNGHHDNAYRSATRFTVGAGEMSELPVVIAVPATLGIGEHAAAFEIASERVGDRPLLLPFIVSIASVERVELTPYPSTIRGRRRATFRLDLVNHEAAPVDVAIDGSSPEVRVRFAQERVQLIPGQHAVTKGKLKGPRRWSGEPTQHTVVITARGRASATSVTAAFVQRPLFAAKLRMVTAALVVIALWAGAIGAFAWWWSNRDDDNAGGDAASSGQVDGVDTDGDGVIDTFYDEDGNVIYGVDTDGDGVPDAFFDADGNPVADPRGDSGSGGDGESGGEGDEAATGPTSTVVRGTVTAEGDITNVSITMTPIQLGQRAAAANGIRGFARGPVPEAVAATVDDGDGPVGKIWSARVTTTDGSVNPVRQSEPIRPLQTSPEADGVWLFTGVALRQSYELVFSKPGFESQSFVITPPADGSPVDLEVELKAAVGAISGRVSGPSGPLGGVAITVSNGSLTFETTSATVGEVGSWSVEGLSTPDVYTVVGELRGFGTEVLQIRLDPGQTNGSANLNMRPGVGSISGRIVGAGGAPLGGVTVTASNGDVSRTTSSLTDGNIGFFNIPQLDIPGTYTLTVEHEGYISQSRRLPVTGAAGGVDFTLIRTTLRLTGQITSSQGGAGIPNAGLTLSNGDLSFKVSTAVDPPGTFVIDDLPTGNYTVTIEHYQHATTTEFLTLTAGVTPPPLNVALTRLSGPPDVGNGTLVVEVVDNGADTAAGREIKNATVKLVRTRTGEELPPITQEAFNFRITAVPVGTYTLFVSAPKYNPAPPRQVSVGLSEQRVEVPLQRLGQASGRVIDPTDPSAVLNDYFITLYRQPEGPTPQPAFRLAARSDGTWQTPPDSLIPGVYRVEINDGDSPLGYVVRNDQVLDPNVTGPDPASVRMRFIVPEGAAEPVVVADIEADPYPEITGRVFRASLASGFVEVDSPDLDVTMTCPGATGAGVAELSDVAGIIGTPANPRYETFTITKEEIDTKDLTGNCQLIASAAAPLLDATMSLPGVDAGHGTTPANRRVSMALPVAPPNIGGRVFWRDGTTPVFLEGVAVAATPVTAFSTIDGTTSLGQHPGTTSSSLTDTTDANGEWDLDGQIHGTTNYTFTAAQFDPASVPFTVDDDGVVSAGSPTAATVTPNGTRYDVELSEPNPGSGEGSIRIRTIKPAPNFAGVAITATSPVGTVYDEADPASPIARDAAPVGDTLGFDLVGVQPGTWTVGFVPPPNHDFFDGPPSGSTCAVVQPQTVCRQVPPGGVRTGFDASLVELGRLELTLQTASGAALPASVTPTITLIGGTHGGVDPGSASNQRVIEGIEVDATDPVNVGRCYTLTVTATNYDAANAIVTGPAALGCPAAAPGSLAIPVSVRAGADLAYTVRLPAFGSISGDVCGVIAESPPAPPACQLALTTGLTVTAQRVDATGVPIVTSGPDPEVSLTGGTFSVTGPAGFYAITVTHPNYAETPAFVPPDPDVALPLGVYQIANDVDRGIGTWHLDILRGDVRVSVFESLEDPLIPVSGATYELLQGGVVKSSGAVTDGSVLVSGLLPGEYRLEIRAYQTPGDSSSPAIRFPAIINVTVGLSVAGEDPSLTEVRAPLPALNPLISGSIRAVNTDATPGAVPLPLGTVIEYVVATDYDEPQVEVDATLVDQLTSGDDEATIDDTDAANGEVVYTFENVPVGAHRISIAPSTITALAAAGYEPVTATSVDIAVTEMGPVPGPEFLFRASNVEVVVQLSAPVGSGTPQHFELPLPASLSWPSGPGAPTSEYTATVDAAGVIRFPSVTPRIGDYQLSIDAALHAPYSELVTIGPSATAIPVDAELDPDRARLEGDVSQVTASGTALVDGPTTVTLMQGGVAVPGVPPFTAGPGNATYRFDVPAGSYSVRVERPGYATSTTPFDLTTKAGMVTDGDVSIDQHATYRLTISNGASVAGLEVRLRNAADTFIDAATVDADGTQPRFTFEVPAGVYRVYARGTSYPEVELLPSVTLGVGADLGQQRNVLRVLDVAVTSPPSSATIDVRRTDSLGTVAFTGTAAPSVSFSGLFATNYAVIASASGFRTQRTDIGASAMYDNLSVTLRPNVTVSGTLTVGGSNVTTGTITATSDGTTLSGTIGTGTYQIVGLTTGPLGQDRTWTINYDTVGVGIISGPVTVTVTATSADTETRNVTVAPQNVTVRFQVTNGGTGFNGALVTFNGSTQATAGMGANAGRIDFAVPENIVNRSWTVTASGFANEAGTVPAFTSRSMVTVNVPLRSREITLTVRNASNMRQNGAVVTSCIQGACPPGTPTALGTTAGGGGNAGTLEFTLPATAGTYVITATHATAGTGTTTIVVASDLSNPTTAAITLTPPP